MIRNDKAYRRGNNPSYIDLGYYMENIRVSDQIVFRKEFFGGLIFKKKDLSIKEINEASYDLLSIIEKEKSTDQIISEYQKKYPFVDRLEILSFLQNLKDEGVLE